MAYNEIDEMRLQRGSEKVGMFTSLTIYMLAMYTVQSDKCHIHIPVYKPERSIVLMHHDRSTLHARTKHFIHCIEIGETTIIPLFCNSSSSGFSNCDLSLSFAHGSEGRWPLQPT